MAIFKLYGDTGRSRGEKRRTSNWDIVMTILHWDILNIIRIQAVVVYAAVRLTLVLLCFVDATVLHLRKLFQPWISKGGHGIDDNRITKCSCWQFLVLMSLVELRGRWATLSSGLATCLCTAPFCSNPYTRCVTKSCAEVAGSGRNLTGPIPGLPWLIGRSLAERWSSRTTCQCSLTIWKLGHCHNNNLEGSTRNIFSSPADNLNKVY